MSQLAQALKRALVQYKGGRLSEGELASWASDQIETYVANPARKYAFQDDATLEALGLVAAAEDAPEPELELAAAEALVDGSTPFSASRLLLLDPEWIDASEAVGVVEMVREAGGRIERGESWARVVAQAAPAIGEAAQQLQGEDYVQLVVLEAAALLDDLRLAVGGTIEVLGKGRPRIDGSLLAERVGSIAQVLRGERPLRALVRSRGAGQVQVVLSY